MEIKRIKITDPKQIKVIKRLMNDKESIHRKIREGKVNEIENIKFTKPL